MAELAKVQRRAICGNCLRAMIYSHLLCALQDLVPRLCAKIGEQRPTHSKKFEVSIVNHASEKMF